MSSVVQTKPNPVVPSPFSAFNSGVDSAQQAVPVPLIRGTQKCPVVWGSIVYGLNAQPTPGNKTKK